MSSVSALGGALQALQIQTQYAARTAKIQIDAISLQGDLALQLLQSASVDPSYAQNLDVSA